MNNKPSYFLVDFDDGTSRGVQMAAGITLAQAREYYIGLRFTDEDPETGAESVRIATMVNYMPIC